MKHEGPDGKKHILTKFLCGKPAGKRSLARRRNKWKDSITV
jgi:hypothetical protein